jgi:hypothetical protein
VAGKALLRPELLAGVTAVKKHYSLDGDHRRTIPSAESPRKGRRTPTMVLWLGVAGA